MQLNEEIREKEVRLLGPENEQLGIISSKEALKIAEEKELDLVMISLQLIHQYAKWWIMGSSFYEQTKKDKEAKKKQKVTSLKEIRFSPTIEEHDIEIKAANARKFLLDQDKVKVTVRFRGREADYSFVGHKILKLLLKRLAMMLV